MESSTSSCVTSSVAGCNEVFQQVDNGVPENCMVVLPECPNSPDTLEDPIKREYTCSTNAASWANTKCVDNKPETLRTKISSLENNCSPRDPREESTSPVSDKRTGFETSQNHKLPVFMTQINHFQSSIPKNPQQAVDLNGRAAHSMPSLGSNESRLTPKMLNCAKVTPARSVSNGDFLSVMRSLAEKQMGSSSKTQTHYPSSPQVLRPPVPPSKYQNEDLGRISPPDDLMTSSNPVNGTSSHIQLWQFLLELLGDPCKAHIISWINSSGEFKLHNSEEVARLWGLRKNKTGMNYDKLSRALRYYYHKGLIKKVLGQKFVYKFIAVPSDANQSSNAFSPSSEPNSPDAVSPNPCSPPVTTARTPKTPIFPNGTPPSSPVVMVCKRPPALVSAKDEPLDLSADTSACPNSTPSEVSRSSLTLNGVPGAKKMFFNIPNSACSTAQSPHHPTLSSPRQSKTPTEDKPCPRANSPILESTPHSSSIPVSTMAAIPAAAASSLYPWFAAAATRDPTMLSSAVCSPVAFPGFPLFYAAPIAMAATGNAHGSLGSCCQQMRATSTSMTNTVSVKNEWTQTEPLEPGAVSDSGKCCECNCRCNQSSPLVSAASSLPSSSFPSSFISTSAPPVSKEGQISTLEDSESVVERSS